MRVASYYIDVFYKQFARALRDSAVSLSLRCDLFDWTPGKKFFEEAKRRPKLLLSRFLGSLKEDLLVIDPDTLIEREPSLLLEKKDFDVAAYFDQETHLMSGPLFLRNNDRVHRLLQEWRADSEANPLRPEMESLSKLLDERGSKLEVARLPVTYAWVERLHRKIHPSAKPVITHFMTNKLITRRRVIWRQTP